jgi:hypothetical protein
VLRAALVVPLAAFPGTLRGPAALAKTSLVGSSDFSISRRQPGYCTTGAWTVPLVKPTAEAWACQVTSKDENGFKLRGVLADASLI